MSPMKSSHERSLSGRSKKERHGSAHQVQGPKITGVGTGSVAADHTLTLIFDSDEEMPQDNLGSNLADKNIRPVDQKRLSEIVEDYLDEGN